MLQAADLLVGVAARNRLLSRSKGLPIEKVMEKSLLTLRKSGSILMADAGPKELESFVRIFRPDFKPDQLGDLNGNDSRRTSVQKA